MNCRNEGNDNKLQIVASQATFQLSPEKEMLRDIATKLSSPFCFSIN